ncbi:hypothetical protein [Pontibacter burrus]|uniref:HEAT repeat domain-containing protein n=1 Tax=Pontibacter burrus TaxID=2704466 RepID=A0A6B3LKK6_9BACT|nr:hypothetical protein [Pontibacter burrus]NEM97299.1 hypothetical protein [Pontibacter burrus]
MNNQQLQKALSQTLTKADVQQLASLAYKGNISISELLELCFETANTSVAFRAAWVLENVETEHPEVFLPHLPAFIRSLPQQQNASCRRHFTNILLRYTNPKASTPRREAWATIADREQVVETVFEWLILPETPIAVRVNCLEILLFLSTEFEWIKEELREQTEFYLKDGSPAMQSRGRKILKRLKYNYSN